MKELYIASLVKKEKVMDNIFICKTIGPIVGLLFGSHFLSSHSKKYNPMFTKLKSLEGNQFYQEIDFSQEPFFYGEEEYAYYELKKIDDYQNIEHMVKEYKKIYDRVCYYIDFSTKVPTMIRYKKKV